MVENQVPSDRHEPGADVAALPRETLDLAERAHEHLGRDVFGQRGVAAYAVQNEAIHTVYVAVVEGCERVRLAVARAVDKRDDVVFSDRFADREL